MNIEVMSFTSQWTIFSPSSKKCCGPLFKIWKMGSRAPSLIVHLEPFAIFSHLLWPFQPGGGKIILFCCDMRQKSRRTDWIHIRTSDKSDLVAMSQAVSPAPLRRDLRAPNLIKSEIRKSVGNLRQASVAHVLEKCFKVLTQVELPQYQKMLQNRQLPCNLGDYSLKWNAALLCCHLLQVPITACEKNSQISEYRFSLTKPMKGSPQLLL